MTESPDTLIEQDLDIDGMLDTPWVVIVWNDPVNLMSYVVHVLQKLFGYSKEKATELMMQVHDEGNGCESFTRSWTLGNYAEGQLNPDEN